MINLPESQNALFQLQSSFDYQSGLHSTDRVRPASSGIYVGHVDFDPNRHTVDMIDLSAESIYGNGLPQVQMTLPYNRLGMNVMIYANSEPTAVDYLADIDKAKRDMALAIAGSFSRLRLSGDATSTLIIGAAEDYGQLPNAVVIDKSSPARATAEIVGRSKKSEINLLESDFIHLNPDDLPATSNTIAIKVNHPWELELPANVGVIALGGLDECNTNKPKELAKTNMTLSDRHQSILKRLASKRIQVLSLAYDRNYPEGVNPRLFDRQLSTSIKALARRRR